MIPENQNDNLNVLYADSDILVCIKPGRVLSTDEPGGLPELVRKVLGNEKAWLITVAANRCRDMQRTRLRHPKVELEKITASCEGPDYNEVIAELIKLPPSVKSAVYLHYIEGYKMTEVSEMLGISSNAVKKRLQRGRKMLKLKLEK